MPHSMTQKINHFALQSFRDTADKDYIHARMAYKAYLFPQFFWSALQALEKYTKCIALLMRIPNKNTRHEVNKILDLVSNQMTIVLSSQTLKFINELETYGARFRYLEVSWFIDKCELVVLDRAVWELRRYCNPLLYVYDDDNYIAIDNEMYQAIKQIDRPTKQNTLLLNGYIEKTLEDKKSMSRPYLVWSNLYFTKSTRKKILIRNFEMGENTPLYLFPEIIDEIEKFIFLPKEIVKCYTAG